MLTYRTANQLMNQMLATAATLPAHTPATPLTQADLLESDSAFTVRVALPGVQAEALEVSLEGRTLTVKGQYAALPTEGVRVHRTALPQGEFVRTFRVPAGVGEGVTATLEHGILTLEIPKPAQAQPRRIEVRAAQALESVQA